MCARREMIGLTGFLIVWSAAAAPPPEQESAVRENTTIPAPADNQPLKVSPDHSVVLRHCRTTPQPFQLKHRQYHAVLSLAEDNGHTGYDATWRREETFGREYHVLEVTSGGSGYVYVRVDKSLAEDLEDSATAQMALDAESDDVKAAMVSILWPLIIYEDVAAGSEGTTFFAEISEASLTGMAGESFLRIMLLPEPGGPGSVWVNVNADASPQPGSVASLSTPFTWLEVAIQAAAPSTVSGVQSFSDSGDFGDLALEVWTERRDKAPKDWRARLPRP